jgi:hypothetical protein
MKRCFAVAVLLVAMAGALTGCAWINQILDEINGDGDGNGGTTPTTVVTGRIEFTLQGTMEYLGGTTNTESVGETFYTPAGTYDAATKTFTATWDDSEFSDTYMEVRLDATEGSVEYFYVRQRRIGMFGDTFYVTEIEGHGIPYTHSGTSNGIPVRHFTLSGMGTRTAIDSISQKIWSTAPGGPGGTELDPWKSLTAATSLVDDVNDDIMISLGWL